MSLSSNLAHTIVKKNVSPEDLFSLLTKYKLLSLLPSIVQTVKQIHELENTLDSIIIEAPFILNEKGLAKVKTIVGDLKAKERMTINKKLLAGFKARYQGKLYDGSAERIIRQLLTNYKN